jgi:predicted PurR-regulated permease PerM
MVLISIVIENFLRPWLVGRTAGIHPLLVLFSVLGGLAFFGPIGLLLGPLALGLFLALLEISPLLAKE